MKALLAIILMLIIGCSGAAQSQEAQINSLNQTIEAMQAPKWTEQDAIAVVQRQLQERIEACEIRNCIPIQDPVLKATGNRGRGLGGVNIGVSFARWFLEHGKWSAVHEPDSLRWRVQAAGGDLKPLTFYAYERTGLVQGVAPP